MKELLMFLFVRKERKNEVFRMDFFWLLSCIFLLSVIKDHSLTRGRKEESTFGRLQESLGLFICSVTHFCQTFFFYLLS